VFVPLPFTATGSIEPVAPVRISGSNSCIVENDYHRRDYHSEAWHQRVDHTRLAALEIGRGILGGLSFRRSNACRMHLERSFSSLVSPFDRRVLVCRRFRNTVATASLCDLEGQLLILPLNS
jgi:hypothetical protein